LTFPQHTVAFYNGIYACSYGADDIESEGGVNAWIGMENKRNQQNNPHISLSPQSTNFQLLSPSPSASDVNEGLKSRPAEYASCQPKAEYCLFGLVFASLFGVNSVLEAHCIPKLLGFPLARISTGLKYTHLHLPDYLRFFTGCCN
jgi:hypothetical protein